MKRKAILLTGGLMLLTLVAVAWLWPREPAQLINLPEGRGFRFVGATWGTNHSLPRFPARLVDSLPANVADYLRAKLKSRVDLHPPVTTDTPKLLLWFEPVGTNWTNATISFAINASLTDEHGVVSGVNSGTGGPGGTAPWEWLQFPAVPRRSRSLGCNLTYSSAGMGAGTGTNASLHFTFRNPLFGHFSQWSPEPLPAVKSTGDLRVQLNRFTVGTNGSIVGEPIFSVSIASPRGTNETWVVDDAELSDATSNHLQASPFQLPDGSYSVYGALWPGESAWRLKLGLKRANRFAAAELITFSNVPVNALSGPALPPFRNASTLTNLAGSTPITLLNAPGRLLGRSPPWSESYFVKLDVPDHPSGVVADIVAVRTDHGDSVTPVTEHNFGNWRFQSMPTNAATFSVTVAVQKLRYVEFLVKPQ